MANHEEDEVNSIESEYDLTYDELFTICKELNDVSTKLRKIVSSSKKIISTLESKIDILNKEIEILKEKQFLAFQWRLFDFKIVFRTYVIVKLLHVGHSEVSASVPEFEIKTGIDRHRIGLSCKRESCR